MRMNILTHILSMLLLDPNVLFLLFVVALIGIFVEAAHPGAIVPGIVGSIALILFLLGAWFVSPNWVGLLLMTLAFVLLLLDVKLPAHGILTAGAVVSLVAGTFLFFNGSHSPQGSQINPLLVFVMSGFVGLIGLFVVTLVVRTRRQSVKTGTESMIGTMVIATTPLQPVGRVNYKGEDWTAILADPTSSVDAGTEVKIVGVEGLLVDVQPVVDSLLDATPEYIKES